jgi:hypothetical protein
MTPFSLIFYDISEKCTAYICRIEKQAEQESRLHGVTSQKTLFFIVTTENLRSCKLIVCGKVILWNAFRFQERSLF